MSIANSCAKTNTVHAFVCSLWMKNYVFLIATQLQEHLGSLSTAFRQTFNINIISNYLPVYFAGPLNYQYSLDGTSTECARTCPGKWLTLTYTLLGTQLRTSSLKTIKTTYISLAKGIYCVNQQKQKIMWDPRSSPRMSGCINYQFEHVGKFGWEIKAGWDTLFH